jgi:hypothetical protein
MAGFLDNFSTSADIRPADDPLSVYLTRERCAAARARRRGDRRKDFLSRFRVTPPRFTAFDAASLAHGADLPRVGVATKKNDNPLSVEKLSKNPDISFANGDTDCTSTAPPSTRHSTPRATGGRVGGSPCSSPLTGLTPLLLNDGPERRYRDTWTASKCLLATAYRTHSLRPTCPQGLRIFLGVH